MRYCASATDRIRLGCRFRRVIHMDAIQESALSKVFSDKYINLLVQDGSAGVSRLVFIPMLEMLRKAQKEKYAVGYFESWNLESTRSVVRAAEEEQSPVIIGFNGEHIAARGHVLEHYAAIGKMNAEKARVPTVLILNEASDYQQVMQGLKCGFTCVMLDGSFLPFEKNIDLTKKIVEAAHPMDVCVEGQFDKIPGAKDGLFSGKVGEDLLTNPERAARFASETGIDTLAVSVGNVHGLYRNRAEIDFERIESIKELTDVPLVLHGATGVSDEVMKKIIQLGVCKINIGAALRLAFVEGMKAALQNKSVRDPEDVLKSAEQRMKEVVRVKMIVYGCSGKTKSSPLTSQLMKR